MAIVDRQPLTSPERVPSFDVTDWAMRLGPDAILESYRWHDAGARRLFDGVDYSSVVEAVEGMTAVIRFTDVLEKASQRHTYSCRQRVTVNDAALIESIVQEDNPDETVAVRTFMERVGVTL